jgi:hypothetical protein
MTGSCRELPAVFVVYRRFVLKCSHSRCPCLGQRSSSPERPLRAERKRRSSPLSFARYARRAAAPLVVGRLHSAPDLGHEGPAPEAGPVALHELADISLGVASHQGGAVGSGSILEARQRSGHVGGNRPSPAGRAPLLRRRRLLLHRLLGVGVVSRHADLSSKSRTSEVSSRTEAMRSPTRRALDSRL